MNILVTGAAGFIGSHLCRALLSQKHTVIAVDNLITGDRANISDILHHPRFTFLKHDIIKPFPSKLSTLNFKLSTIYHLACPTGVPNLTRLAEEMLLTSSIGTRNILELARKHNATFLLTSSSESYGNPLVFPQKETYTGNVDPTGIRSPYEEGKRFAESLTVMYSRKYKLNTKIVRIFNTYGPNMSQNDLRVIPMFLHAALNNQPIPLHGAGLQKRTFCYVDDMVGGLIIVMRKGNSGEVYNIGSNQQTTIKKLAHLIIKISRSNSKIVYTARPSHDHQARLPDLTKIKRLGWKPQTTLLDGLKLTLQNSKAV